MSQPKVYSNILIISNQEPLPIAAPTIQRGRNLLPTICSAHVTITGQEERQTAQRNKSYSDKSLKTGSTVNTLVNRKKKRKTPDPLRTF